MHECTLILYAKATFLILNRLNNTIYKIYNSINNIKTLKFDLKTIIDQVQEFQLILHDIYTEEIVLSE